MISPKKLWIISLILLIVQLIIQFAFFENINLAEQFGLLKFGAFLFIYSFIVFILGGGLGALLALFPFKQLRFKEKFKTTFPLLTAIVLLIYLTIFSYLIYVEKVKGIELKPLTRYEDIQAPLNLDCSSIRVGNFESEKTIITRDEWKQTHIDKKSGEQREFNLYWENDCEYILTAVMDSSDKIRVKITSVNPESYGCYVVSDKYGEYPNFVTIKRTINVK